MASRLQPTHNSSGGWKKGQSGNPKGRPKGRKSRRTLAREAAEKLGMTPLEYMLKTLNGSSKLYSKRDRQWAAEKAIPYTNRRMPIAIEGGDKPLTIIDPSKIAELETEDIEKLVTVLEKLGVSPEAVKPPGSK